MAAFLAVKDCRLESLTCVGIFVGSILYMVCAYEPIIKIGEFDIYIEQQMAKLTPAELEE